MTTYKGNSGVAKIGANAIAELKGFTVNVKMGTVEDTALGDTARTRVSDELQDWDATITGHFFPGDTNGQALLVEGASLSLEFHPTGTATGRQKLSGTGIVDSVTIGEVANAAIVPFSAHCVGSGALARANNS